MSDSKMVSIDYVNYRGERKWRTILPRAIRFANSEHHPDLQWVLDAFDYSKRAERTFAMRDIKAWLPIQGGSS